jgi:putative flippase GtrA
VTKPRPPRFGNAVVGRGLRYLIVSVVNVPVVQLVILLLQVGGGLDGWVANLVAVSALTWPAYVVSKRWVWGRAGDVGTAPIAWFWFLSIGGLMGSTVVVYMASRLIDGLWVANAANLATYGAIFIVRFAVLDGMLHPET